ncbi:hypothetical protein Patl1_20194 [Pistacia atlantica]|uniref:Uncharacterized protein n=1 Tax=Pistacia atlantica TaxID=434234 RepID=A0ACC1BJQ9_9ROSI|nr:hypothetical protein Patl1_20194 [Pistacia atlantica]
MGSRTLPLNTICFVVFLAWLLVWVLLPTKIYKQTWTPKLNSNLNSTYFREKGTNLLLFSFPIMLIAVLGCVYLHLQKKPRLNPNRFLRYFHTCICVEQLQRDDMQLCDLLETSGAGNGSSRNCNCTGAYFCSHVHSTHDLVPWWQAKFRSVSLRLGYIGNTCWAFLFFPVTRASSILPLVGLTSESSIKYHIWLGHLSNLLFVAHTVGFIIYWAMTDQMIELLEWSKTYVSNLAGMIATVIAVVMWVTSMPRFRRKMFEVFFYTHHLYIIFIIFYVLHVGSAYFCMILPGIFLFVVDRYLRFLQSRKRARLLSARLLPCDVVELNFSKSAELYYNPTSILFINVPSISKLQWHPFTVTSNCNMEQDKLSIVCKSEGSWTQRLYQEISSSIDRLEVSVEGPYGPNSADFLRHEKLVMVCGGSGISPFISIIREIIFQSTKPDYQAPTVHLICAFKNFSDLSMLDLLLPISGTPAEISKLQLQIEVYVTREIEQPKTETQKLLQSLWFKANPLDSPISTALGPKTWLWLGAIIASSFVMFLLLLGIITRYYIYPIERNGTEVYHYSYKCLWDMFLVCACICIASSAVFLWCKKENDHREEKQIQNVEVPTPTTSPGSWLYSADRELESLPNQSLVEVTKVHFGERPNLKKILFGLKGSDVGVLVCGPKKMRYEVAKICASGLADNLHFESISFNW